MPDVQDDDIRDGGMDQADSPRPSCPTDVHTEGSCDGDLPEGGVRDSDPEGGDGHGQVLTPVPSPEVMEEFKRMKEDGQESVTRLNDFLSKLLTLNTALIGGGMVLAKGEVMPMWVSTLVVAALCASAVFCLDGLRTRKYILGGQLGDEAAQVCAYLNAKEDVNNKKGQATKRAMIAFGVALAIGLAGMTVKAVEVVPTPSTQTQK